MRDQIKSLTGARFDNLYILAIAGSISDEIGFDFTSVLTAQ